MLGLDEKEKGSALIGVRPKKKGLPTPATLVKRK